MNIFVSDNETYNYFENLDWTNIAICGSIMAACLPRYIPIMLNYIGENNKLNFLEYSKTYYEKADIDIMIAESPLDYINKVYYLIDIITNNIKRYNNDVDINIEVIKTVAILIDDKFIIEKLLEVKPLWKNNPKYNINYIKNNLNSDDIKKEIYKFYIEKKLEDNRKYDIASPEIYLKIVDIDNVCINYDYNTSNENYLFMYDENIKYKVSSKYLRHNLEIFRVKYNNFFSTVSKFHIPIVRSYYNGKTVYILPSCISACMSYMSIDYKYFSGSKDPLTIINKYRLRGFGTYLNDKEKINYVDYISKIDEYKQLYQLNLRNSLSVINILKELQYDSSIYKKKNQMIGYYPKLNFIYIDPNKANATNIINLYEKYYNVLIKPINKNILLPSHNSTLGCINNLGYVKQFNKWIIDMMYENENIDN
jgi:hypothetical protein